MNETRQTQAASADYIIGIDLGTTHTVVSYASLNAKTSEVHLFKIAQLIGPGKIAKRPLLPSFRYHPLEGEIAPESCLLPWQTSPVKGDFEGAIIGYWAKVLGSKVSHRLVSSAKSWLCHSGIDREAKLLPLNLVDEQSDTVERISPVIASASYLNYIKQAWNHEHPQQRLEHQQLVITLPASFDEVARNLTCKAAELAGLNQFRLLEEPQAACYDWQHRQQNEDKPDALPNSILVCDIGGGTTDLSLINVSPTKHSFELSRSGVGKHLLLGGDNIDLALARQAEKLFRESSKLIKSLKPSQLQQLIQQCSNAKERILAEDAPAEVKISLLGQGSGLFSGAMHCQLNSTDIKSQILDGFFPLVEISSKCLQRQSTVQTLGLPYEYDAAISRHIAEFLQNQHATGSDSPLPDAVLLNGGLFNSKAIQSQVTSLLSKWRGSPINVLSNPAPDLAVSQGAVYYGLALLGKESKIGGGSPRNYFLLLDNAQALCLLPKGSEEEQRLEFDRQFMLKTGIPVKFNIATTQDSNDYKAGALYSLTDSTLLPPLVTALDQKIEGTDHVEVRLSAEYTTLGTLDLVCHEHTGNLHQWRLEFDLRSHDEPSITASNDAQPQTHADATPSTILPPKFKEACSLIERVYSEKTNKEDSGLIKTFRQQLEKLLGDRNQWSTPVLRALGDLLISLKNQRKRSQQHERIWLNLTGFCMRPGFGDPADAWRIEQLWPLFQQGLAFNKENNSWSEWWTFWRRLAGGLSTEQQTKLSRQINKYIQPSGLKNRKLQAEAKSRAFDDMIKLAASLEKIEVEDKSLFGKGLLSQLQKQPTQPTLNWALGRVATRHPFHGSMHQVLPPKQIQPWIDFLLSGDWKKNSVQAFAVVMMTRKTDDPSRDINEHLREKIINKLTNSKVPVLWIDLMKEVIELGETETQKMYGESLPSGISLIE
jgi:molecular chaperone DnaK (HSP70)